jgi:hypothetical protein
MPSSEHIANQSMSDSPAEVFRLAETYRVAAMALLDNKADRPSRLCALHAIELYLNAFLLSRGEPAAAVRAREHDLGSRCAAARARGLVLRRKTEQHLLTATERREYLVARYDAGEAAQMSRLNRLTASLAEIAAKVRRHVPDGPSDRDAAM